MSEDSLMIFLDQFPQYGILGAVCWGIYRFIMKVREDSNKESVELAGLVADRVAEKIVNNIQDNNKFILLEITKLREEILAEQIAIREMLEKILNSKN